VSALELVLAGFVLVQSVAWIAVDFARFNRN
jgi:hypothetical protein